MSSLNKVFLLCCWVPPDIWLLYRLIIFLKFGRNYITKQTCLECDILVNKNSNSQKSELRQTTGHRTSTTKNNGRTWNRKNPKEYNGCPLAEKSPRSEIYSRIQCPRSFDPLHCGTHQDRYTLSDKISADNIFGTNSKFRQFCPPKNVLFILCFNMSLIWFWDFDIIWWNRVYLEF